MRLNQKALGKVYLILAVADLVWSICAWIFDWQKLQTIPIYLLPFILTCPLYPLFLSISWFLIYKNKKLNLFIFYLGVAGSIVYGVGAVLYYPIYMSIFAFDWYAFGGIFWVLFYAIQAVYLLLRFNKGYSAVSLLAAGVLIATKIAIDYYTRTYGYIVDDNFPQIYFAFIIVLMVIAFLLTTAKLFRLNKLK